MQKTRFVTIALTLAVGCTWLAVHVPAQGRGGQPQPRTRKALLAWADTRNGIAQHASVSHALAVIERLGYESGAYDTYIRTDSHIIANQPLRTTGEPASGGPSLRNIDGIFFVGHREVPLDDQQKVQLLAFVRNGGGFVAAHTATTAFLSWPEFGELLGGRYDEHPWGNAPGTIITEDPAFPVLFVADHYGRGSFLGSIHSQQQRVLHPPRVLKPLTRCAHEVAVVDQNGGPAVRDDFE